MQSSKHRSIIHLQGATSSLVVDASSSYVPRVIYWGEKLLESNSLASIEQLIARPVAQGTLDEEPLLTLLPESSWGFNGSPGLHGQRQGLDWSSQFTLEECRQEGNHLCIRCVDSNIGLLLTIDLSLDPNSDVIALRTSILNTGDQTYQLNHLVSTLPIAPHCNELMSFGGRWCQEYQSQRHSLLQHAFVRENRAGRTSHQHFPGLMAGTIGFSEQRGEVYGFHLGANSNHQLRAERLFDGRQYLQMGELLLPGEIQLEVNTEYHSPWLYGAYSSKGLQGISDSFHRHVRQLIQFPDTEKARPVHLNTWEAMYFDHEPARLSRMIKLAASVGIERFIIDDGWFIGRNSEQAGLGDWYLDQSKYPDGLEPIIEQVHNYGMEFGLWFEPEMLNPDSNLYRAHPEWVLRLPDYEQPLGRYQHVLNLTNREAYAYLWERLNHFLSTYRIDYIKWDMNRDLVQPASKGIAVSHQQSLALHRLLSELRLAHPHLEIENCCSGGARSNYETLKYTHRIWTSDCNDALERQSIQRNFSYFFPPEIMGAHIGPEHSHTTGRQHHLEFRALTALFGHFGVEADLEELSEQDRASLKYYIDLHKQYRHLLHTGRTIRLEVNDQNALAHGVVNGKQSEALFCYVQLQMPSSSVPPAVKLSGLKPAQLYRIKLLNPPFENNMRGERALPFIMKSMPEYLLDEGLVTSGEALHKIGLQLPVIHPESALLIHVDESV